MASFEFLAIIVSVLGLAASITYYAIVLANSNKTRQSQIAMNFYTHVTRKEFWKQWANVLYLHEIHSFPQWAAKYGPNDTEASSDLFAVMQMFVGAGVLLKKKIIDPVELFTYLPHVTLPMTYLKVRPFIMGMRETYNDPLFGIEFENLYNEAIKLYPDMVIPEDRAQVFQNPPE